MKVKIRQLPDAIVPAQKSDYFVLAQSSGGQVTRKLTMGQLAGTLFTSGSYISISNGVVSANSAGINLLLDPRFNAIEGRLTALEGKVNAIRGELDDQPTGGTPTTIYFDGTHVNSGGAGQATASAAVVNLAKSIFKELPAGSTVMIRWYRYWSWGTGNGSASRSQYFVGEYKTNGATNWTFVKNTSL
jgi:hypothetical protein